MNLLDDLKTWAGQPATASGSSTIGGLSDWASPPIAPAEPRQSQNLLGDLKQWAGMDSQRSGAALQNPEAFEWWQPDDITDVQWITSQRLESDAPQHPQTTARSLSLGLHRNTPSDAMIAAEELAVFKQTWPNPNDAPPDEQERIAFLARNVLPYVQQKSPPPEAKEDWELSGLMEWLQQKPYVPEGPGKTYEERMRPQGRPTFWENVRSVVDPAFTIERLTDPRRMGGERTIGEGGVAQFLVEPASLLPESLVGLVKAAGTALPGESSVSRAVTAIPSPKRPELLEQMVEKSPSAQTTRIFNEDGSLSESAFDASNWRFWWEHGANVAGRMERDVALAVATGGGATSFAAIAGGTVAGEHYDDAVERIARQHPEWSESERQTAASQESLMIGAMTGLTERLPGGVIFSRVPGSNKVVGEGIKKGTQRFLNSASGRITKAAIAEGAQEIAQEASTDLIKHVRSQDPEAFRDWKNRYATSGVFGALAGGGMATVTSPGIDAPTPENLQRQSDETVEQWRKRAADSMVRHEPERAAELVKDHASRKKFEQLTGIEGLSRDERAAFANEVVGAMGRSDTPTNSAAQLSEHQGASPQDVAPIPANSVGMSEDLVGTVDTPPPDQVSAQLPDVSQASPIDSAEQAATPTERQQERAEGGAIPEQMQAPKPYRTYEVEKPRLGIMKQIKEVGRRLGVKVRIIDTDAPQGLPIPGGFVPGRPGEVWISQNHLAAHNNNVAAAVKGVVAHELFHSFRVTDRAAWDELARTIEQYDPDGLAKALEDYKQSIADVLPENRARLDSDPDFARNEAVSKYIEDRFTKYGFWSRLARENTTLFEKLADWLRRVINTLTGNKIAAQVGRVLDRVQKNVAKGKARPGEPAFQSGFEAAPAYHGSPHRFDKFTTEKIGTGEGAQVYGWGLYFAGSEGVGRFYRDKLANSFVAPVEILEEYFKPGEIVPASYGYDRVIRFNPKETWYGGEGWSVTVEAVRKNDDGTWETSGRQRTHSTQPDAKDIARVTGKPLGQLYKVDLKPEEDQYLDWDKPLSEQSEYVRNALSSVTEWLKGDSNFGGSAIRDIESGEMTGRQLYHVLTGEMGIRANKNPSPREASLFLLQHGIRGNKYLDQGSRSRGKGSYNYVIFDDADISIEQLLAAAPRKVANVGTTPEARKLIDDADATRTVSNRADVDVVAEAEQRLAKDYQGEYERLVQVAREGGQLGDTDTLVAKSIVSNEATKALASGDKAKIADAVALVHAYRQTGTEQARAFRQRRDPTENPTQRVARLLSESILKPPKKTQQKIENQRKKGNEKGAREELTKWSEELERLAEKLAALDIDITKLERYATDPVTSAKIVSTVAAAKADWSDKMFEYWRNAILSAPPTQIVNIVGNAGNATYRLTAKRLAEVLVNSVVRDPGGAQLGELKHLYQGVLPGMSRAAQNFLRTWKSEVPYFESELGVEELHSKLENVNVAIEGRKGKFIRIPQRLLLAADEAFKSLITTMEVGAYAYRMAKAEGLSGEALAGRIDELTQDTQSEAWDTALASSRDILFQSDVGKIGKGLLALRRTVPGVRYIVPFLVTPTNIFKQGIKMTPLGSLSVLEKAVRQRSLKGLTPAIAEQVLAWTLLLALMGNDDDDPWITGAAQETDYRTREASRRGIPSQSIKIGDTWYSYSRVEPFATALATTVDLLSAIKKGDPLETVAEGARSLSGQLQQKTFLQGVGDVVEAAQQPEDKAPRWAASFATSWIPNIVRSAGRAADDTYGERRIWGEGAEKNTRFLRRVWQRTELPGTPDTPAVDIWGREATKGRPGTDFVYRFLSPINRESADKALLGDRALLAWNNAHPGEEKWPVAPQPKYRHDGKDKSMTDQQYHDFMVLSGQTAQRLVSELNIDPVNPDEGDIEAITSAISDSREIAKRLLVDEWENGKPVQQSAAELATMVRDKLVLAKVKEAGGAKPLLRNARPAEGETKRQAWQRSVAEWEAEVAEAGQWLRDRGVSPQEATKVLRTYRRTLKQPSSRTPSFSRLSAALGVK